MEKVCSLFVLAMGLATMVPSSAAVFITLPAENSAAGANEIRVTLKPGESYNVASPKTEYPGAPFDIEVADPGNAFSNCCGNSWLMSATLSVSVGSMSWLARSSLGSANLAGYATPGETVFVCAISDGSETAAVLQAVPLGKVEGIQLLAPASSPFGTQTFIIRISAK